MSPFFVTQTILFFRVVDCAELPKKFYEEAMSQTNYLPYGIEYVTANLRLVCIGYLKGGQRFV